MTANEAAFAAFTEAIGRVRDDEDDILLAAARLPQYADPDCDPQAVLDTVHKWSRQLRGRIAPDAAPLARLRLLNFFFFDELGFRGNEADYYNADNSYLHRVIGNRCGIPISLAVLYLDLGHTIGLRLHGINFPAHFLVGLALPRGAAIIDVFARGATLDAEDLRRRLRTSTSIAPAQPLENFLRPIGGRDVLARMLRNLKGIHVRNEEWPLLLEVQNRLVALLPDNAEERRDRALAFDKLECPRAAADDLSAYLAMQPRPPDAQAVRRRLRQLQQAVKQLN